MPRINQHGEDGSLYDMPVFIEDAVKFFDITHWIIQIEWCTAEDSDHIEKSFEHPKRYSTKGLRSLYSRITQTIDGKISAYSSGEDIVTFEAVDSSFWDVSSRNEDFNAFLEEKYGVYVPFST